MAHKYSTFTAAFAALNSKYLEAQFWFGYSMDALADASTDVPNPVDKNHFDNLCLSVAFMLDALNYVLDYNQSAYDRSYMYESIYWAWKEVWGVEEYELTWQKICEAWAANDFEGRAVTIAFIDRMRQILWDEPFSALWAARPSLDEG